MWSGALDQRAQSRLGKAPTKPRLHGSDPGRLEMSSITLSVGVVISHRSEISFVINKDDFKYLERSSWFQPTIVTAFSYHVPAKLKSRSLGCKAIHAHWRCD